MKHQPNLERLNLMITSRGIAREANGVRDTGSNGKLLKDFYAFYAFYAWWIHFPQSGALAEGTSLPTSRKCDL
jgi:hypothetical protein